VETKSGDYKWSYDCFKSAGTQFGYYGDSALLLR